MMHGDLSSSNVMLNMKTGAYRIDLHFLHMIYGASYGQVLQNTAARSYRDNRAVREQITDSR